MKRSFENSKFFKLLIKQDKEKRDRGWICPTDVFMFVLGKTGLEKQKVLDEMGWIEDENGEVWKIKKEKLK